MNSSGGYAAKDCSLLTAINNVLQPECVIYYHRGHYHENEALSDEWEYYWFTFDGHGAESMLQSFDFPDRTFHVGPAPEGKLLNFFELINNFTPFGARESSLALYDILMEIKEPSPANDMPAKHNDLPRAFAELVKDNYQDENFNVNVAAKILCVHRITLFRALTAAFGMCPAKYISMTRIQRGMLLLRATRFSVKEIAERIGIKDASYFSRIFKEHTTMTPKEFRRLNHS